jgi:Tol biopolymer transport system component
MLRPAMRGPRRVVLVTVAAVVATTAGFAAQGRASFPGPNGDIFFTGYDPNVGAPLHVYSVHPDGSSLRQLTSGPADDQAIAVAPGGSRIVVSRDTHEQCGHTYWAQGVDLFTIRADGTGLTRLTNNCPVSDSTPAWSPGGNHLVFSRFGELWSIRTDGSDLAKLTCNPPRPTGGDGGDYAPVWSPDGRTIAFQRFGDVDVMDANGDNAHIVATGGRPAFSPDGTRLAYSGPDFGDAQGLHVVSTDGTGDTRLTTGRDWSPVWSPDGTKIAFVHVASITVPQKFVIETVNANGSDPTTITDSVNASWLDWASPAGNGSGAVEPNVTATDTSCAERAAAPVTLPEATPVPSTSILASTVQPPDRLLISRVAFKPNVLRSRKAFVLRIGVRDAEGLSVANAVVQATSLRGDALPTALRLTGADGTAELRVTPTRRLRLAEGSRLVLLVRARRPIDGWAGPVSGTRLVSVRTAR